MRSKTIIIILLAVFIAGFLFIHFYAPHFITGIRNPIVNIVRTAPMDTIRTQFTGKGEDITFTSADGLTLKARWTYARSEAPAGAIILLHGIRNSKEHFAGVSRRLADSGYHAVALDLRAHGESEGVHCTFGVRERDDVSRLAKLLLEEKGISGPIGLWGQSLGGAVALQTLGNDAGIDFGVVESTFTDFRTIAHDYFSYHLGADPYFLSDYLITRSGTVAAFDTDDARPLKYCGQVDRPILLVHGTEDRRIDISNAEANFKALKTSDKKFLKIPGANHLNVWQTGGEEYFTEVFTFLDKVSDKKRMQ